MAPCTEGPSDLLGDDLLERVFDALQRGERRDECRSGGAAAAATALASCGAACTPAPPQWSAAAALPAVCRRWRRVYNTSTLLHGTFNVDLAQLEAAAAAPADAAALRSLLEQRGQAARRLWMHREGQQLTMAAVLQLLSPQLQAVYLGTGAPQDALRHLHRFTQLRCLDLPATAYAEGQLARFSQLEELTLREGVSAPMLSALASLPRLRLLSLTLVEALPAASHRQLAALRALEELHLYLLPRDPTAFQFQPAALAALGHLRAVLLIAPQGSMCEALTIGPGLPQLAALQELQVEGRVESLPADLWACCHLTRLELDLCHSSALPTPAASPSGAACLPALRTLRLVRCQLPGGALPRAVFSLASLTSLEVRKCGLTSSCTCVGVPAQFSRLSRLEHLSLEANALCTLPPELAALSRLRHLNLSSNQLAWLPPGPYLRSVETLLLSANRLAQVPPVLGGACALEVLDLSSNPCLELSRHDVDATLSRMPRLSLLLLGKQAALGLPGMSSTMYGVPEWRTPSVAALVALGQALPQLQIDFEHTAAEYEGI